MSLNDDAARGPSDTSAPITAVITGGAGDLARAIRAALEAAGNYRVLTPGRGELDVADAGSVSSYFARCGEVDLLVNNAGLIRDGFLIKQDESDWDAVLDVNLRGAFLCSRAVLRQMLRRCAGHVINVGSFSAVDPPPGQANYAAAKAGLIGLTQSLAAECGSRGVRANCVMPGFLETKMTANLLPEAVERARARHVLGRFNTPEDAGRFIAFLDGFMPHVSGQVFQLDSRIRRWT